VRIFFLAARQPPSFRVSFHRFCATFFVFMEDSVMRHRAAIGALLACTTFALAFARPSSGDDGEQLLTIDHYVRVRSTVPAISGQATAIYVRERLRPGTVLRGSSMSERVVLFVHGAGTPAEVAFDVPLKDYSWMAYLAQAGFDVFSLDVTGYGRSTRPAAMNDPCNLARDRQPAFVPSLLAAPCDPSHPHALTTIASDWNDIGAVVDYIRTLRRVDRVSLVAWSLGGPRAGGYAAQHPERVQRLVLLAPGYNRTAPENPPSPVPEGAAMNTQSHEEFVANWDRQVGCPEQYEPAVSDSVWSKMLESDPVGATWGPGVRRAPQTTTWGWNLAAVAKTQTPTLMVAGAHDKQVQPARVKDLYADLGSREKVFVDLACSSHNAMWERNHTLLFRASLEWLTQGTVRGQRIAKRDLADDVEAGWRRWCSRRANQFENAPERVADDVQLAIGVDGERADVAELFTAAKFCGVFDEVGRARVSTRGVVRQRNRPHATLNEIGEEISALIGAAQRSTAVDEPTGNRLTGVMVVFENRFCERHERGWPRRDVVVRALTVPPSVVAPAGSGGLVVDFFETVLTDVADHKRTGPAARGLVERIAPRVAQTERPDFRPG
jgi:pimeloyl-ACP methyl ester carboxylesterase